MDLWTDWRSTGSQNMYQNVGNLLLGENVKNRDQQKATVPKDQSPLSPLYTVSVCVCRDYKRKRGIVSIFSRKKSSSLPQLPIPQGLPPVPIPLHPDGSSYRPQVKVTHIPIEHPSN